MISLCGRKKDENGAIRTKRNDGCTALVPVLRTWGAAASSAKELKHAEQTATLQRVTSAYHRMIKLYQIHQIKQFLLDSCSISCWIPRSWLLIPDTCWLSVDICLCHRLCHKLCIYSSCQLRTPSAWSEAPTHSGRSFRSFRFDRSGTASFEGCGMYMECTWTSWNKRHLGKPSWKKMTRGFKPSWSFVQKRQGSRIVEKGPVVACLSLLSIWLQYRLQVHSMHLEGSRGGIPKRCISNTCQRMSNIYQTTHPWHLSGSIRIYPGPPNVPRANHSFLDSALAATNPPKKCQHIGTVFGTVLRENSAHRHHKQRISLRIHANTVSHDHGWSALTLHAYLHMLTCKLMISYDILPCESYLFISVMSSVMLLGL